MIEIDGSYGEGGGQILRTAVSLSALSMRPIRIVNIRARRPTPGLKRQHIAGIELVGKLVNATIKGLEVGSTEVEFVPRERIGGHFVYDVGTAGAISLVLQAVLPVAVLSPEKVSFDLQGGTDVAWSPPIDYMREVFVPMMSKLGLNINILLKRRGHYPKGGGRVLCFVEPAPKVWPLTLISFGDLELVEGISHSVRLPVHVTERLAESAEKILREKGIEEIRIERESHPDETKGSPGSGIVLWATSNKGVRLGADALGEKRKRAETVGAEAANKLLEYLNARRAIDPHLADMLVTYLALAAGVSQISVSKITSHLTTNIWAIKTLLGIEIKLESNHKGSGIIVVKGGIKSKNY